MRFINPFKQLVEGITMQDEFIPKTGAQVAEEQRKSYNEMQEQLWRSIDGVSQNETLQGTDPTTIAQIQSGQNDAAGDAGFKSAAQIAPVETPSLDAVFQKLLILQARFDRLVAENFNAEMDY